MKGIQHLIKALKTTLDKKKREIFLGNIGREK